MPKRLTCCRSLLFALWLCAGSAIGLTQDTIPQVEPFIQLAAVEDAYALGTNQFGSFESRFQDFIATSLLRVEIRKATAQPFYAETYLSCPTTAQLSLSPKMSDYESLIVNVLSKCNSSANGAPRSKGSINISREFRRALEDTYRYDPVLMTLLAGLESRAYSRGPSRNWKTVALQLPSDAVSQRYYSRSVEAHYRPGSSRNGRCFVLLNASYSTWKRGSWINKTISALDMTYPSSHLIVLEGFLTPQFLKAYPDLPELSGQLAAEDLYFRLKGFLSDLQREGKIPSRMEVGLLGFSGGANVALSLLAVDSTVTRDAKPLFSSGAIAYSPILDLTSTFSILDDSSRQVLEVGFPKNRALTTFTSGLQLFWSGYSPDNLAPFFKLLNANNSAKPTAQDFIRRFYREFTLVDLKGVVNAPYVQRVQCSKPRESDTYQSYYEECVFPLYRKTFALGASTTLSDYADFLKITAPIRVPPVYIVFAQDDPVLAVSEVAPARNPELDRIFNGLRQRKNFRVFAPERGAHLGYMLDSVFLTSSIRTFFDHSTLSLDLPRAK